MGHPQQQPNIIGRVFPSLRWIDCGMARSVPPFALCPRGCCRFSYNCHSPSCPAPLRASPFRSACAVSRGSIFLLADRGRAGSQGDRQEAPQVQLQPQRGLHALRYRQLEGAGASTLEGAIDIVHARHLIEQCSHMLYAYRFTCSSSFFLVVRSLLYVCDYLEYMHTYVCMQSAGWHREDVG